MVETAQAGLLIRGGPNNGRTVSLSGRPITLGRWPDNDVIVEETTELFDIYQMFVGVKT